MLINSIREAVSTRYSTLQPLNAGIYAPRTGYYLVEEVFFERIGIVTDVPYAIVRWAKTPNGFLDGQTFKIELLTLFHPYSIAFSTLQPEELIGKVIRVVKNQNYPKIDFETPYSVIWEVVPNIPTILSSQDVFFSCFFHGSKTVSAAYRAHYLNTLPLEIIEEIDWQENLSLEQLVEDVDSNDTPDADTGDLHLDTSGNYEDPNDAPDAPVDL